MSDMKNYARDAAMMNGTGWAKPTNGVQSDRGLNTQYFADATRASAALYGNLADNCYDALCQGLIETDWYAWTPVKIRTDFAARSSTGELMPDDWQRIHIIQPSQYTYIPPGAYLRYAGNTWIVYKSYNMGVGIGQAVIRRCNQMINRLDWYGNLVSVPMSYAKMGTLGNSAHASENSIVAKNYINCLCQRNENSADFDENTRIILNKTAYAMRGVNNFTREFTEDEDSIHLISFTIERVEPITADNLTLSCADYGSFSWEINIQGSAAMKTGGTQQLQIGSRRNGAEVETTGEHPISYIFSSSDHSVLTVDETGTVTAHGTGEAAITAALSQNPAIQQKFSISVADSAGAEVAFTSTPPAMLKELQSCVITAAVFENGEDTGDTVTLSGSGASEYAYAIEQSGTNEWTLTCYAASGLPLTLTAERKGRSAAMSIRLIS